MSGPTTVPVSVPRRRRLALALLVAAPLVAVPGGFSGHVPAQLLVVALGCLVAVTVPPLGTLPRPLVVVGAAWLAVLVLAALAGDTPVASLVGRWPRYEGLPVLALYAAAAWAGARVVRPDEAWLGRALAAASVVLGVASVVSVLGGEGRSGSLLGNASDQGAVAMMAALVLARPAVRDRAPLEVVGLAAALTAVAASGSRAALVLTAVGLVVLLARVAVAPLAGLVAGLVGLALTVPSTRDRLLGSATAEARLDQWPAAIPKIEVRRAAVAGEKLLASTDPLVIAIAADYELDGRGKPVFTLDDISGLAALIEDHCGPFTQLQQRA